MAGAKPPGGFVPFGFFRVMSNYGGDDAGVGEGAVQSVGVLDGYGVENGLQLCAGAVLPPVNSGLGQHQVAVGGGDAARGVVAAGP